MEKNDKDYNREGTAAVVQSLFFFCVLAFVVVRNRGGAALSKASHTLGSSIVKT